MHELSVCRDIIDIVTDHLDSDPGNRVRAINLDVGPHSCVNLELIRSAFRASTKDTPLADAELACRFRPERFRCPECGNMTDSPPPGPIRRLFTRACPACGSRRVRPDIDDDIKIRSMVVE